jgi:L-lactate dehydrogenase complex protein LldG
MEGTIQNRDQFLNTIAKRLGRARLTEVEPPKWKYQPQYEVFKDVTQDELVDILEDMCDVIHTKFYKTDKKDLPQILNQVVEGYGGGPILTWKDKRYEEWGLGELLHDEWPSKKMNVCEWDYKKGEENIQIAEKANVGITISEITLAESGTVVVYINENRGRSINFLPATYIALIPKSTIVPRMTQAAKKMREIEQKGGKVPSCINFITGPSNSADIELNLVVGVHGPIKASYILINDL